MSNNLGTLLHRIGNIEITDVFSLLTITHRWEFLGNYRVLDKVISIYYYQWISGRIIVNAYLCHNIYININ